MELATHVMREVVALALREDIGSGDLTSLSVIPASAQIEGRFELREAGVVCGLPVIREVFAQIDPTIEVEFAVDEGSRVEAGTLIATVRGPAHGILSGERVALNLAQRMSGTATATARYVDAIKGTKARILDTRKTTPGLRALEKYAVRVGGGTNHRFALYDGVMLKDNHLALLASQGIGLAEAIQRAQAAVGPMVRVEVEVENIADAIVAAEAGASMILLDNMSPADMAEVVRALNGRALLEASGGITLNTVRAAAESGVDFISVGALTHAARALDIGLDF
jgi:nicotinate-nucleotide pyrophosphorylase (carboxylating)